MVLPALFHEVLSQAGMIAIDDGGEVWTSQLDWISCVCGGTAARLTAHGTRGLKAILWKRMTREIAIFGTTTTTTIW